MAAVACINAIVGGVAVALALRWLLAASVPVARRPAHWWPWAWPPLCFGYQVRRFRGATALVLELYEGPSPGMPGWTERADRREA